PDSGSEDSDSQIEKQIDELDKNCAACAESADDSGALQRLSVLFGLDRVEQQCLILCLASEMDPKYARVYAFLQDDLTRKLPTLELPHRLFSRTQKERAEASCILSPQAALCTYKLIHLQDVQEPGRALSPRMPWCTA